MWQTDKIWWFILIALASLRGKRHTACPTGSGGLIFPE